MKPSERQVDLVLDSGAFSVWKRGETLTLPMYIDFLDRQGDIFEAIVNLDVIPGRWTVKPSAAEVEESASKGRANALALRKAGHEVMPVFHMGENLVWLKRMIDDGFKYIGISPANDRQGPEKVAWLDDVFEFLCGTKGYPAVKTHGFGVTAVPILYRYPWYSADSVTWLLVGGYGGILVPKPGLDGQPDYSLFPTVMSVSSRPLDQKSSIKRTPPKSKRTPSQLVYGRHFGSVGEATQEYMSKWALSLGFNMDGLKTEYIQRQALNAAFYKITADRCATLPFRRKATSLFSKLGNSGEGQSSPINPVLKHVFSLTSSKNHSDILQDALIRERLLTYYYFIKNDLFDLSNYVKTGRIEPKRRGKVSPVVQDTLEDLDEER